MLQKLSNGAKGGISKFILVGFLFMAVAGLVLTDVGGFFRDGVSSTSVAAVGSEDIPYHEFDRFLRNVLTRQNISPEEAFQTGQLNDILQRYAQDILFKQASEDLGIRVPDEAIAKELHRFVRPYITDDTTPQEALNTLLRQQGLSEENFVDAIRRDLTSNILKQAILSGNETAPEILSEELMRYENEYRDITFISLPHSQIEIDDMPTEEELQQIYDMSQAQYRIPERRGFTIAILNPETVTNDVEVSEEELRTYYDNNKTRYEIPSGTQVEQAIFQTEEAANTFLSQLDSPENFEDKAGDNYRSSNTYQEDNAPEALKDLIFSEDETPVRGPVQSPLGWHVIHDMGEVETSYRPFEDVKATIKILLERELKRDAMMQTIDNLSDRIDDEEPLAQLVEDYKLETLDIQPIDQFGMTAENQQGLASFEQDQAILLENLFDMYVDELSEIIELQDGRIAILKINNVVEESLRPFDNVKEQIRTRIINERKRLKNQEQTQAYLEQLKNNEITLSELAQQTSGKIETKQNIKRSYAKEDSESGVSVELKARIFMADPETYIIARSSDGIILATSDNRRLESEELTQEMKNLAQRLTIMETLTTYYNHLADKTPVRVNQRLLQQLYGQPQG